MLVIEFTVRAIVSMNVMCSVCMFVVAVVYLAWQCECVQGEYSDECDTVPSTNFSISIGK